MLLEALRGPGAFRLILASAVFVHHISRLAIGPAAVYLFFCLSGFWIYRMWVKRYSVAHNPLATYAISRIWRLLPTFLLVTVLVILVELAIGTFDTSIGGSNFIHFVISSIFIIGYNALSYQPVVPAWSLDIEAQFYIIAPLVILIVAGTQVRAFPIIAVAAGISAISCFLFGTQSFATFSVFFAIGIACAHDRISISSRTAVLSVMISIGFVVLTSISPIGGVVLGGANRGSLMDYNQAFNVLLALMFVPYAMYTTTQIGGRFDSYLADLSYIVYLMHWAAVQWLGKIGGSALNRLPYALCSALLVYGISVFILYAFERPINKNRVCWVKSRLKDGFK